MIAATIAALLAHFGIGLAGFLALFGLGTVVYRLSIGRQEANDLNLYIGSLVLVAGTANEVVGVQIPNRWPSNTVVMCSRITSGGAAGHLACDFNSSTGTVTITSSSGTDTSTVMYLILAPIG